MFSLDLNTIISEACILNAKKQYENQQAMERKGEWRDGRKVSQKLINMIESEMKERNCP